MSNNKERKIPDYLKFPFERYIMVRVEFLILTQNELEAKIMRIIEWAIESRRDELSRKGEDIPDEVWVTIPESIFIDWLYGTVQSETTFTAAIKSLIKKHLIFKRPSGPGRYDALEYTLNKPLISKLFEFFPEKINEVDMASIMKQPRKSNKESEGQLLTPSKIDPLIKSIREAIIDPLNSQLLTPSTSIIELGRGAIIDPKKERKESKKERKKENGPLSPTPSLSSLSIEDLVAEIHRREHEQIISSESSQEQLPTNQRRTDELNPLDIYDDQEKRIHGYWQELGYEADVNLTNKGHWGKVARHIHSLEEMKSLYKHALAQLANAKDKTVYPGNMAKSLNGWKQEQERKKQLAKPVGSRDSSDPIAKYREIGARFINQGAN